MDNTNSEPGVITDPPASTGPTPNATDAANAAWGRSYAASEAEQKGFTALVEYHLRGLGVMAPATIPGDIPPPPGELAPGQ